MLPTGRQNGSGMAFAGRSSNAITHLFVWSRGEDLMTDKFPEYHILKDKLPDGIVLDGEIIPLTNASVKPMNLPFCHLLYCKHALAEKMLPKKQLKEAPIGFFAYDLLEINGEDCRNKPLKNAECSLEKLVKEMPNQPVLRLSPIIHFYSLG